MSGDRRTEIMENWLSTGIGIRPSGAEDVDTINKWGLNLDIDTPADASQVIWPVKKSTQDYVFIDSSTPIAVKVVSTSANDIATTGTGARTIKIMYQEGTTEKEVILDMNGIAGTNLPESIIGSFRMSVETSGASNKNEGDIKIVDQATGLIIYSIIETGQSQTQIAVQRVPEDKTGLVTWHRIKYARSTGNNGASTRLVEKKSDGTEITKWDSILTTLIIEDEKKYETGGITIESGSWVYWICDSVTNSDTPLLGAFDIVMF
jgi:hypothetical protein